MSSYSMQTHKALKPLCWLIGKWKSIRAKAIYPTMKPFPYCEEMEFMDCGQPLLNYRSVTWNPADNKPMHLESGFLRIKPNTNQVALLLGHNFGVTSLEEGTVDGTCIYLKSSDIGRMSFARDPAVLQLVRFYRYWFSNKQLEMVVYMATCNTPLTEHLRVQYERDSDCD